MKLKKIVKHIGFDTEVKLYVNNGKEDVLIYEGNIIPLQVAADNKINMDQYIDECRNDGDIQSANEVIEVKKYIDYKLNTDDSGEAIHCGSMINNKGVTIPTMDIYLRKD